jgi:hypothetical protein
VARYIPVRKTTTSAAVIPVWFHRTIPRATPRDARIPSLAATVENTP